MCAFCMCMEKRDWKEVLLDGVKPLLGVLVRQGFERLEARLQRFEQRVLRSMLGVLLFLYGLFFLSLGIVLFVTRFGIPLDAGLIGLASVFLMLGGFLLRSHGRRG